MFFTDIKPEYSFPHNLKTNFGHLECTQLWKNLLKYKHYLYIHSFCTNLTTYSDEGAAFTAGAACLFTVVRGFQAGFGVVLGLGAPPPIFSPNCAAKPLTPPERSMGLFSSCSRFIGSWIKVGEYGKHKRL